MRQKDARIRGSKEWSKEKISGSGGGASKGRQDQGVKRMEQRKHSRIRRLLRKEGLQDQGDKRMGQRKDSRIRPLMHKNTLPPKGRQKNPKNTKNHVAASQDALYISSRIWAHSVQFENKTSL